MRDYEEKSYYEIQLDNKQLILVFLASLVLCVLIFVLGVMVGKGQKEAEMAALTTARPEPQAAKNDADVKPPEQPKQTIEDESNTTSVSKTAAQKSEKADSKKAKVATANEGYSFYDLDKKDNTTPGLEKPETKTAVTALPAEKQKKAVEPTSAREQPSGGTQYTVQVMATSSKSKADEQMVSLRAKGFKPFVDEIKTQGGTVYKVRVGKFSDSSGAKELASRLREEMKLEPWVTPLN